MTETRLSVHVAAELVATISNMTIVLFHTTIASLYCALLPPPVEFDVRLEVWPVLTGDTFLIAIHT